MDLVAGRLRLPLSTELGRALFLFLSAVVLVQGVHVVEHVIQLVQVYVLGVPEDEALGLLGYVLEFQGTEEWLHLGFNSLYLAALYALVIPLRRVTPSAVPKLGFAAFLTLSVGLETWHVVEHGVIISNVIANDGCPCPGIGDAALGLSDAILHFFYNAVAYSGVVIAFAFVVRDGRAEARRGPGLVTSSDASARRPRLAGSDRRLRT